MKREPFSIAVFVLFFVFICKMSSGEVKKEYYPDGKIKRETPYKDGKQEGTGRSYYENGGVENEWYIKNGKNLGWKEFDRQGRLREKLVNDENGNFLETVRYHYYQSGQLEQEVIEKEGQPWSVSKIYYEQGGIYSELVEDKDGRPTSWKFFSPDGKLISENSVELKDKSAPPLKGTVHKIVRWGAGGAGQSQESESPYGLYVFFYDANGNLLKDGLYREYETDGKIKAETPYKNYQADGLAKRYYQDGKLSAEIVYENGKEISRKEYDEQGKLKSKTP